MLTIGWSTFVTLKRLVVVNSFVFLRIQSNLFFSGEVLNVDGITGGFNFRNAWSGGYIGGTSIGNLAAAACPNIEVELSLQIE